MREFGKAALVSPALRLLIALAVTLLAADRSYGLDPDLRVSQYAHTAWRVQDGFLASPPRQVTQTTDGYIWVGTKSGVLRFDGVTFTPFAPPGGEELRSLDVYLVLGTRDGSLWISGAGGGLWQWKGRHLTKHAWPDSGVVLALAEGEHGEVWLGQSFTQQDSESICKVGSGAVTCYSIPEVPLTAGFVGFSSDGAGGLWVATDSVVLDWRPGAGVVKRYLPVKHDAWRNLIHSFLPEAGRPLIGLMKAGRGFGVQTTDGLRWRSFRVAGWDSSNYSITAMLRDRSGALWVATTKASSISMVGASINTIRRMVSLITG